MRSEPRRALVLIVASRALSEGVGFVLVAALLHALTAGRGPLPVVPACVALFGVTLVLTSVLRERGTLRQGAILTAAVIGAWAAWGLTLQADPPNALAVLTRVLGFALAGEAYLWRILGIARGLQRWREVRDGALFALAMVVVTALAPWSIDRDALPPLALGVAVLGAVALSLARSTEELSLGTGQVRGRPTSSPATGTAFALGLLAIAAAAALPAVQEVLGRAARAVGPLAADALFLVLLPLGYVAAYLVYLAQWLRERLRPTGFEIEIPRSPFEPGADAERLREFEAVRPFIFGALELALALIAVLIAVVIVARLVQERRAVLPEGVELEREEVEGIGLRATLRRLLPARPARPRPPTDNGTRSAALLRLYWRLLELAEREGPGRRAPAETPAEHEARLARAGARWNAASRIVRAFEDLRYGERDPDDAAIADARAALGAVEAGTPAGS